VFNDDVLSDHPLLSGQFLESWSFVHINAVFVTCIRRPPLSSGRGHPVAILCLSFFVIFACILSVHPEHNNYKMTKSGNILLWPISHRMQYNGDKLLRSTFSQCYVYYTVKLEVGAKCVKKCQMCKFNVKHRERLRDHPSQRLMICFKYWSLQRALIVPSFPCMKCFCTIRTVSIFNDPKMLISFWTLSKTWKTNKLFSLSCNQLLAFRNLKSSRANIQGKNAGRMCNNFRNTMPLNGRQIHSNIVLEWTETTATDYLTKVSMELKASRGSDDSDTKDDVM